MFSMKVQGGAELARRLNSMSTAYSRPVLLAALRTGGVLIRDRAADLAPRAPGEPDLAENIGLAAVRERDGEPPTIGIGPSKRFFFYDWFQEYGTVRHGAQPFYRPAFDELVPQALGVIGSQLWAALASTRGVGQGSREAFAGPRSPSVVGGPGGGTL